MGGSKDIITTYSYNRWKKERWKMGGTRKEVWTEERKRNMLDKLIETDHTQTETKWSNFQSLILECGNFFHQKEKQREREEFPTAGKLRY